MPALNKATVFISGKLHWAKIVGEPRLNYNQDAREWAFELEPNAVGLKVLAKQGLADRIKGKGYNVGQKGQFADREPFIQLKKSEFNKDGNPNTPIRLYDADDGEWDGRLVGNETEADVKLDIRDYGPGKKKGVYPVAIRITTLVPFQTNEFGGMEKDEGAAPKKVAKKTTFEQDFGLEPKADELNDEIPL